MDDMEGFESLVRANWPELMAIARALTHDRSRAEDLIQTALVNAFPRWTKIRPGEAMPYLRTSIVNAHISAWRRVGRRETSSELFPEAASTSPYAAADDRLELLGQVRELPPRQRAVIVLRYLCDLSDAEIATTLGIDTGTVRSNAHRGLARLRKGQTRSGGTAADQVRIVGEC
jgi:RNA polymerase sigma-70 factor (sigma-E family)